jgi:pilus assembly protein CpaB
MVMSRARILLLVIALVAGGLAAFLATRSSAPPAPQTVEVTQIKQEPKAKVLVASKPIGVGERLGPKSLEWQDWPQGAVRPEYVTSAVVPDAPEKLTGAVARFEFFPGEPIREAKLARADQGYLSAVITPGMRAVAIDVTAATGAGGFIVPNDRVDVVLTRRTQNGEQSETILRNVKVLAIGPRLGEQGATGGVDESDPRSKTFEKATIATLELSPRQSETLINSTQLGQLALALRSVADFGEQIAADGMNGSGATIRMVRFGKTVEHTASARNFGATQVSNAPAQSEAQPQQTPVQ